MATAVPNMPVFTNEKSEFQNYLEPINAVNVMLAGEMSGEKRVLVKKFLKG